MIPTAGRAMFRGGDVAVRNSPVTVNGLGGRSLVVSPDPR